MYYLVIKKNKFIFEIVVFSLCTSVALVPSVKCAHNGAHVSNAWPSDAAHRKIKEKRRCLFEKQAASLIGDAGASLIGKARRFRSYEKWAAPLIGEARRRRSYEKLGGVTHRESGGVARTKTGAAHRRNRKIEENLHFPPIAIFPAFLGSASNL